jgi:tRNA modification GTPase
MRAFLAGRLDLTQAEAVLGVIEAEQRGSLDHALRQLAGNLSKPLEQVRSTLLNLLADVEAGLDFVDEDIEFISDAALVERLSEIRDQLTQTLEVMQNRSGGAANAIVVLRGQPNAGKSCLLNRLAGQDFAIVADVAGTTRDVVTLDAKIAGRSATLIDTAGIETANSDVSQRSQEQAQRASQQASVRLWCVDLSQDDLHTATTNLQDEALSEQRPNVIDIWVGTKADLVDSKKPVPANLLPCSAVTGDGMAALSEAINQALLKHDSEEIGSVVGTAARCSQSLANAITATETAISLTQSVSGHEFVAAELRTAAACLGEVTGEVYTDDILDRVFGRFCIGK